MDNYVIDRTQLTEQENEQFDALVAKAMVDPKAAQEEMEEQKPEVPPKKKPTEKAEVEDMTETKKAAPAESEVPQFVLDAIAKSNEFIDAQEKKDMLDIAKKYTPLTDDVEGLAKQLGDLKKKSPEMYEMSIGMMDKQMAMVTKPDGMFGEIGKSLSNSSNVGGSEAKAKAKAQEIMKADPSIDYDTAIAKAYMDPAIMAECDDEYYGRR